VLTINGLREFEFINGTDSLANTDRGWTITKSGSGLDGYCEKPGLLLAPEGTCDGTFVPTDDYKFCYSDGLTSNELLDFSSDGTFIRGDAASTPGLWYYDGCTLVLTINGLREFEFINGTDSLANTDRGWTITKSGSGPDGLCEGAD